MEEALVSIVVPCFNQAQYLPEALESVLAQTFPIWECIIVNDGSPDNTQEIALDWCNRDKRFRYLKKENGGLSSARNAGIKIANGKYILPLDADDKIDSNYLQKAINLFEDNQELELVYCRANYFGEREEEWLLPSYSYSLLLRQNHIFCSCIFLRSKAINVGLYDECITSGWEDYEFLLRLLNENSTVIKIDDILFYYRIKVNSMLNQFNDDYEKILGVREKIYAQHAGKIIRLHKDWISLIDENDELKQQIINQKNFVPRRSLKNLLKFLTGRKLYC